MERLDRIEESIAALSESMNFLVSEFIRPNAQQAQANRLDLQELDERINRIVEMQLVNAEQIAAIAQQATVNEAQIASNTESLRTLRIIQTETDQRFNILVQEMRADRQESRAERRAHRQSIQAFLLQLANVNGEVENLGDRVDQLEAS